MAKNIIQNLLVIGVDTVSIASSAKKRGYKTYAADYFGDIDLRRICIECKSVIEQKRGKTCGKMESVFKPEVFLKLTKSLLKKIEINAILLSSGLDDHFDVLNELNDLVPILGNHPKIIERVREKPRFFEELKRLGIPYPKTVSVKDVDEARVAALEIGYPVVIKPIGGFGGIGIRMACEPKELERAFFETSLVNKNVLLQKFIEGVHASISFLASGEDVKVLSINEQLLGLRFVFQQEPFGYCGNIVPLYFADSIFEKCKVIAKKIALQFGLKGSNGVDLVFSTDGIPYIMEVNPRFQATLECVEKILGINMVESHINTCVNNSLPIIKEKTSTFCTRLILHSPKRTVAPNLSVFQEVRNVPLPEVIIEKGEPLCSIITEGNSQKLSFQKAKRVAMLIYSMLRPA